MSVELESDTVVFLDIHIQVKYKERSQDLLSVLELLARSQSTFTSETRLSSFHTFRTSQIKTWGD